MYSGCVRSLTLLILPAVLLSTAGAEAAQKPAAAEAQVLHLVVPKKSGGFYHPNVAPLAPSAFLKLPIGAIIPHGWLREQLKLDASGLVGKALPEVSPYLKPDTGWVKPSNAGWEELPYWLKGYGDLSYILQDPKMIVVAKKWINGIIATQQQDGWFGPERNRTALNNGPEMWPNMLVVQAMRSYYSFSHDPRIFPFLIKYFTYQLKAPVSAFNEGWGAVRWSDGLDSVYWLYNRTRLPWLLTLAKRIHDSSADYVDSLPTLHNVNLSEGIREPAEYWQQAKQPKLLQATEDDYDRIMESFGQVPGGGFAGDENARPGYHDPRQGFETCGMVEMMHTDEDMTRISGNPNWADRCEDMAFNSLPAAVTPDHRGVHYITPVNVIELGIKGKQHQQFDNGTFPMLTYGPAVTRYRCCPHNYGMGWPYYVENTWLATADKGLCASLYAPSEVTAKVGEKGVPVHILEETGYPFHKTVGLTLGLTAPTRFPLYLRIPRWCYGASVKVNGRAMAAKPSPLSYLVLTRTWKKGDRVTLTLPMQVSVKQWSGNDNSVSVYYGPLAFSLDIGEKWKNAGGRADWPNWAVYPTTPWNYGLVLNPLNRAAGFKVVMSRGPLALQPFTPETSPIKILAPARQIPDWTSDSDDVVGLLQPSPAYTASPLQMVTLIPMGAARLRIAEFPTVSADPKANHWKPAK